MFKDTVDTDIFVTFLREQVAPILTPYPGPRSVLMLDNAPIHHAEEIRALVEDECGARLIYLPPYSPHLNPAEQAFSFIKSYLKRHENEVVDQDSRIDVIHRATQAITSDNAVAWIKDCGYD
ncbi:hypothetical protein D9758_015558 [Tetrapyrgos nigripes]|uniref:Tc1-like transposase DDE domain-containing protein n=1 Tax=Tetrapyrgos nigripes TaxID=182062 RepID=A0A8H5FJG9_9AGAR|nr:hypothetical protein D9758_015558 [Tetrapyrgos nigripes]